MFAETDRQLELKKHVNTIHCTNNLSLLQRKLFNVLLFHAYRDLPIKAEFEISVKHLCGLIGYNSNDYKKLKKAFIDLMSITIEWNVVDNSNGKNGDKWSASSILAAACMENGLCKYEYSSILRELLYRPDLYGRICLKTQRKFKSNYGLALYENCIRYKGIPQTPWYNIDTFRKLMGVSSEKYPIFKDFKKRVVDIAVDEVNEHSNITVNFELRKQNRDVEGIRFRIFEKIQSVDMVSEGNEQLVRVLSKDFNLSSELTNEVVSTYDINYILEKVSLIKGSKSYKEGKIQALSGYFLDALKKDYQPSHSSLDVLRVQKVKQEEKEYSDKLIKSKLNKITPAYHKHLISTTSQYLATLRSAELTELADHFMRYVTIKGDLVAIDCLKKSKFEENFMKIALAEYLIKEKKCPHLFITLHQFMDIIDKG